MDTRAQTVSTEFTPLLKCLQELIEKETKRKFNHEDFQLLESVIRRAVSMYEAGRYLQSDAARSTFYKLYAPLRRVIELLKDEGNAEGALIALDAYSDDPSSIKQAQARREVLLRELQSIYEHVPPPPPKRGRGKPSENNDLRALVYRPAAYWEKVTGQPFKQNWHDSEPLTPATQFVYEIVKFVDPRRLPSLSNITEEIVKAWHPSKPKRLKRRAAASRK